MHDDLQLLVRSVFKKDSLDDCSLEELEHAARNFPYFAPAQLLLAEKLKSIDENLYQHQVQKLSLYFQQPLRMDYLLNGFNADAGSPATVVDYGNDHLETEEQIIEQHPEIAPIITLPELENDPTPSHAIQSAETPEIENKIQGSVSDSEILAEVENTSHVWESTDVINQEINLRGVLDNQFTENKHEHLESEIDHPAEIKNTEPGSPVSLKEEQALSPETISSQGTNDPLIFEPFHTVDYFASQGIKLKTDEKPTDRFGQQLKSFTEWLKTMKRLPDSEIAKNQDVPDDKVVQLAEVSVSDRDVITEAMAEVWIKQGNKEKAIEIYNKLSLLNPSKNHYFAAKIEQLKNT